MTQRTLALVAAAALGVGACTYVPIAYAVAEPAQEQQQREPGGSATFGVSAAATVKAIDPATRIVTLTSSDGEDVQVKCGKQVRNFDQLKVGDQVRAAAFARLVVTMGKDEDNADGDATSVIRTPEGGSPGILIARTQQRTAKVEAIDPANRTVTLSGLDDESRKVPIAKDVDLTKLKVGDESNVRVTRGVAIWVPQDDRARPAAARFPGGGDGEFEGGTATVTAVDAAKGTVTIKGAQGRERQLQMRPGSENFERIKVGDTIRAAVVPELVISLQKSGEASSPQKPGMAAVESKGARPGLLLGDTDELKGKIESVDASAHTITITESDGDSRTIRTAPRVELSDLKAGDEVTVRLMQPVAIKVEHQ
jgi:Cu/Ag efflux protein CusF